MRLKIKAHEKSKCSSLPRAKRMYRDKCEECGQGIVFSSGAIQYGEYGCAYTKCPGCGQRTYVPDANLDLVVTADNLKYPQYFAGFSDAVKHLSNEEIEKECKRCIKAAEDFNNESHYATCAYGDALIIAIAGAYETYVYVCKNYEELIIDKSDKTDDKNKKRRNQNDF